MGQSAQALNRTRLPHIGWWLLAIVPVMLLALIGPFALNYYRVQQINAVSQPPGSQVNPLECGVWGPEWLQNLAARWGCEDYLRTRVERIEFVGENYRDEHLRQIPNTAEIERLTLINTQITDEGLASLEKMPRLHAIFLENAELGPGMSSFLRNSPNLESLYCSRCSLVPDALVGLPPFPMLKSIHLKDVPFRSQDRLFLVGLPNLVVLDLPGTEIDDEIVGLPSSLFELKRINLSRTRVGDTIAAELSGLSGLTEINLSETLVTDRGAEALAALDQLQILSLSGISLTDQGTTDFDRFRSLAVLDVSNTNVSDKTLRRVLKLKNLVECDLSGTDISDGGLEALLQESPPSQQRWIGIADTAITDGALARAHWKRPSWRFARSRLSDFREFYGF